MKKKREPVTVVLADDQAEVRNIMRRHLDKNGNFDVVGEAEDGLEAVRLVTQLHPDALLLDLAMPGLNGIEVLTQLKEVSPDTVIIVLSSMVPFEGTGEKALELGAAAAFDKYASPKKIIARLLSETDR